MTVGHGVPVQPAPPAVDELVATLGGAPLPEPTPGESEKQARKRRKREGKLRRDSERRPTASSDSAF